MYFQSLDDVEFSAFGALPDLEASALGTNARAEDLYMLLSYGCYFQLNVGDKPMFFAPLWFAPAGGGPSGFTTENVRHVITNGIASAESILLLGKDIHAHTLRHTWGNYMVNERKVPLPVVQGLMGHARLETTGIYTKANPKKAANTAFEAF